MDVDSKQACTGSRAAVAEACHVLAGVVVLQLPCWVWTRTRWLML
jgi:hypothetical protein